MNSLYNLLPKDLVYLIEDYSWEKSKIYDKVVNDLEWVFCRAPVGYRLDSNKNKFEYNVCGFMRNNLLYNNLLHGGLFPIIPHRNHFILYPNFSKCILDQIKKINHEEFMKWYDECKKLKKPHGKQPPTKKGALQFVKELKQHRPNPRCRLKGKYFRLHKY